MKGSGGYVVRVEVDVLRPDGRADPGHFVGEGAGGFVVADALFERAGPLIEPWQRFAGPL